MGIRGRHGVAELAVIGPTGIETIRRLEPPDELTDEQAAGWRAVGNRMSADWLVRLALPPSSEYGSQLWAPLAGHPRRLAPLSNSGVGRSWSGHRSRRLRLRDVCPLTPCPVCLTTVLTSWPRIASKAAVLEIGAVELVAEPLFQAADAQHAAFAWNLGFGRARFRPQLVEHHVIFFLWRGAGVPTAVYTMVDFADVVVTQPR